VLAELGVRAGDRVFALAGRIPEFYVTALGTLEHRAVFYPLLLRHRRGACAGDDRITRSSQGRGAA
jgi:acyl-coenzyme A synthetase/AMP-(fatty) acid ligase